jgi:hypothetical protein
MRAIVEKGAVTVTQDHHAKHRVYPIPRETSPIEAQFCLDESSRIVVPEDPDEQDLMLARSLVAEVSDRYGLGLPVVRVPGVPSTGNVILIGSVANPLVREWCAQHGLDVSAISPGAEGYVLRVDERSVVIAGCDERGAFYGLQSLRQLLGRDGDAVRIPGIQIRDWPYKPFRGIRLYLPGSENLAFFRRFVRDFVAMFKFNKLIVEVNACMRLDRHPELNAGYIEFAQDLAYTRASEPINHRGEPQNSAHQDAADGGIVEKAQVAEIVRYANQHHIEVIPEIPSLTHSFYLLARHRDLAEIQDIKWPDTYCPLNPQSYELLFDVLDEYIEVMQPKMVHIGHDEWRMAVDVCERCRGQAYTELFARDVIEIHRYLSERGIRVAMWGDHLMESVRNVGWRERTSYTGRAYRVPGALSEAQVRERIPKDILIFNWFWADSEGWLVPQGYRGEDNDLKLEEMGFKQVYGNFGSRIENWGRRSARDSVLGGAPSSWIATTEFNLGKDLISEFMRCANLLWSTHWPREEQLVVIERDVLPQVRQTLRGRTDPSQDGDPVVPLDITAYMNASSDTEIVGDAERLLSGLATGQVGVGRKVFRLEGREGRRAIVVGSEGREGNPLPREVNGIAVERDASSLIFLHACARPGQHLDGHHEIYNPADTSELLGWYEVLYEDGFVDTIPIRYGVNILDGQGQALYGADVVDCAAPGGDQAVHFYAFEWRNPRFGRVIRAVNLKGAVGYRGCREWYGVSDEPVPSNAVILLAISVVERRAVPYVFDTSTRTD